MMKVRQKKILTNKMKTRNKVVNSYFEKGLGCEGNTGEILIVNSTISKHDVQSQKERQPK